MPKDPIRREEYIQKLRDIATENHKNPEYAKNFKNGIHKRSQNPIWAIKNKENAIKRSQDLEWRRINKENAVKCAQNPVWKRNHKESMQKRSEDPIWRQKNKEMLQKLAQDPTWKREHVEIIKTITQTYEWRLKQKESRCGGFWYGNVRYGERKTYCVLWCPDLWHRIDEAQNYQSILSGKTKEDNGGRTLSRHHVYWQPKACCEWDEDVGGYYCWIDIGTKKKTNKVKYYINGDPNKFVLLTSQEHGMVAKDKLKWIKIFEDLIESELGGVCYLPKKENS